MLEILTMKIIQNTSDLNLIFPRVIQNSPIAEEDDVKSLRQKVKSLKSKLVMAQFVTNARIFKVVNRLEKEKCNFEATVRRLNQTLWKQKSELGQLRKENEQLRSLSYSQITNFVDDRLDVVRIKTPRLQRVTVMIQIYKELFHNYDSKVFKKQKFLDFLTRLDCPMIRCDSEIQSKMVNNPKMLCDTVLETKRNIAPSLLAIEDSPVPMQNVPDISDEIPSLVYNSDVDDLKIDIKDSEGCKEDINGAECDENESIAATEMGKSIDEIEILIQNINPVASQLDSVRMTSTGVGEESIISLTKDSQTHCFFRSSAVETDSPLCFDISVFTDRLVQVNKCLQTTEVKKKESLQSIKTVSTINGVVHSDQTFKLAPKYKRRISPALEIINAIKETNEQNMKHQEKTSRLSSISGVARVTVQPHSDDFSNSNRSFRKVSKSTRLRNSKDNTKTSTRKSKSKRKCTTKKSIEQTMCLKNTEEVSSDNENTVKQDMSRAYNICLKNDSIYGTGWTTFSSEDPKVPVIVIGGVSSAMMPCLLHEHPHSKDPWKTGVSHSKPSNLSAIRLHSLQEEITLEANNKWLSRYRGSAILT